MTRQCEHCDNPDKDAWQTRCLYKGPYASRRAFVLSTFDAPCAGDAYDDRVKQRRLRNRPWFWAFWLTLAALLGMIGLAAAEDYPVGTIITMTLGCPAKTLPADGSRVSCDAYPKLCDMLAGDRLPDLRGVTHTVTQETQSLAPTLHVMFCVRVRE